jgi:hypothetical protein
MSMYPETRYEIVFEASGVVGKGTAEEGEMK